MPSSRISQVHHLYYSTWRAWLLLIAGLPFGLYSLVIAYAAKHVVGDVALLAIPILVAAYGYLVYRAIDRIRRTEPVVSMDDVGILDRRLRNVTIPWTAVRDLYIGPFGSSTSLLIAFRSTEDMERALGRSLFLDGALTKAENLIIAPGAQWGVQLGQLRCSASEVLALAKNLHAAAQAQGQRPAAGKR